MAVHSGMCFVYMPLHTNFHFSFLRPQDTYISLKHEGDKVIAYERGRANQALLFIFNFHPTESYRDYPIGSPLGAKYAASNEFFEQRSYAYITLQNLCSFILVAGGLLPWTVTGKSLVDTREWIGSVNISRKMRDGVKDLTALR